METQDSLHKTGCYIWGNGGAEWYFHSAQCRLYGSKIPFYIGMKGISGNNSRSVRFNLRLNLTNFPVIYQNYMELWIGTDCGTIKNKERIVLYIDDATLFTNVLLGTHILCCLLYNHCWAIIIDLFGLIDLPLGRLVKSSQCWVILKAQVLDNCAFCVGSACMYNIQQRKENYVCLKWQGMRK